MKVLSDERLALIFVIEDGEITCRADYKVMAEDLANDRSLALPLTANQKNTVATFATAALNYIKGVENIV